MTKAPSFPLARLSPSLSLSFYSEAAKGHYNGTVILPQLPTSRDDESGLIPTIVMILSSYLEVGIKAKITIL